MPPVTTRVTAHLTTLPCTLRMGVYKLSTDSMCVMQSSQRSTLPGLQDLKGQWSGGVQAYGGGGGATNVDFNVRGQSWQWGEYALDQA